VPGDPCKTTSCNPKSGQCEVSNAADGTNCTLAGNLCAPGICVQGSCSATLENCTQPTSSCQKAECNPRNGNCEVGPTDDGVTCNSSPCVFG
jgi:hypothetical protein